VFREFLASSILGLMARPESESSVTTEGQPASLSWNKAPVWGLRPDFCYYLTVAGLLIWGTLSDERAGLSFTIAFGPRQRSHFQDHIPCNSWLYFTVSDSRLPYLSHPTTRRVTVEVFEPNFHTGPSHSLFLNLSLTLTPMARLYWGSSCMPWEQTA
jgi:hypothetical protein